jgi:hypothetical protein
MHIHQPTTIVGACRPRLVAHLVIASIAMTLVVAAPVAAEAPRTTNCGAVTTMLTKASSGLLMPSESDYPFTAFSWPNPTRRNVTIARVLHLTGRAAGTPVEVVDLDHFFRNVAQHQPWHDREQAKSVRRFKRLQTLLERHLTDVRVYRVGTIRIDAYIVGRCGTTLTGLSTTLIET